jgi:hypothetical protein
MISLASFLLLSGMPSPVLDCFLEMALNDCRAI